MVVVVHFFVAVEGLGVVVIVVEMRSFLHIFAGTDVVVVVVVAAVAVVAAAVVAVSVMAGNPQDLV